MEEPTVGMGDAYDEVAELYASLFCGDLEHDPNAQDWLARFAELAHPLGGVVADLGCGPGHVVRHLVGAGLDAVGYDLSPGQIAEARSAFPDLVFDVADFTALDMPDASLAGIVSRYSIIHLSPSDIGDVFCEWRRLLRPGAPLLVSFFGATATDAHGTPFDHTVATAYALSPTTIARHLDDLGFTDLDVGVLPPPDGGRPFDQATVLARRSGD